MGSTSEVVSMGSPNPSAQTPPISTFNAEQIDLMYGLDPIYEPGQQARQCPLTVWLEVCCPHCWRSYGSEFELGSDSEIRIEDCPQCCGAIELQFQPEDEHGHYRLDVNRAY